jgi:hypothetical protein
MNDYTEKLRALTERQVYRWCELPKIEFIKILQRFGLLHSRRECISCGGEMKMKWKKNKSRYVWICKKRTCRVEKGFLLETFFDNSSLDLKVGLLFLL